MGSSKKHKEKDRERRHKHRRRSRSKSPKEKRRRREARDIERRHRKELEEWAYRDIEEDVPPTSEDSKPHQEPIEAETPGPSRGHGGEKTLSIEETNKIRAKLGLKPLDVGNFKDKKSEGEDGKPAKQEDVHAPPVNLSEVKKTTALREKMDAKKEKRKYSEKLSKIKTLGESDDEDENAATWVRRVRKMQKEKALAEKRAKMLEEMDEEFGIGDIMSAEFKNKEKTYSARDLKGLKVEHDMSNFREGQTVILTLKDRGVLDEEGEESLINVNMVDDEHYAKNVENKKKRPEYKPYDEPEMDEYGMMKPTNVLDKYDEEIEGLKKKSFQIGSGGRYDGGEERHLEQIRAQLRQQGQSLSLLQPQIAGEFFTEEEMEATKFKKVKKKTRKIRQKKVLKADDLVPLVEDNFGSRMRGPGTNFNAVEISEDEKPIPGLGDDVTVIPGLGTDSTPVATNGFLGIKVEADPPKIENEAMDIDPPDLNEPEILGPDIDLEGVPIEEDTMEDELYSVLNKARKLKQKRDRLYPEKIAELVQVKKEMEEREEAANEKSDNSNIILNSTSEFCRALGDIPTYGLSGNRDVERDELMDEEMELEAEKRLRQEEEDESGRGWNRVEIDETPVDIGEEDKTVLDEEPVVSEGLGAALQLAMKKGYLEKESKKLIGSIRHSNLEVQNYTIEDKRYDDLDEKFRKRDRYMGGATMDFKEKNSYRPDIKLEYVDDAGRLLNEKEAFRQLSHRFHGKGSGKKKTEKRMKKVQEENLMKQMSSTDTPLNTVALLQEKQRVEKSPYIILSGNRGLTTNSVAKTN
ncbi:hypothetical protein ScPMuIL_013518 [Solemya velum]